VFTSIFLISSLQHFWGPAVRNDLLIGCGAVRKKDGWQVSKYKAAGDKFFTLKIRKAK